MKSKEARDLEGFLDWADAEEAFYKSREAVAKKLGIAIAYEKQVRLVELLTEMLEDESERLSTLEKMFAEQID